MLTFARINTHTYVTEADDLLLLANTPAQTEFLQYSQEQAAGDIGFHVNVNKIEEMCLKQKEPPPL